MSRQLKNMKRNKNKKGGRPPIQIPRGITMLATGKDQVFGFPNRLLSKLRYCDTYQIVSTAGSLAKQVLYVNSTFDPDNTGTGHQPLYRDTFAAIYDQYAVVCADVKVTFVCNAVTSALLVGMVIDDDNATSSTVNTLCEQSNGQSSLLPSNTGAPTVFTFMYHWDCKKILEIDPYTSQTYKTPVGSNPAEISSLLLWAQPADVVSTTTTTVHVELEQTVLWTELTTPTQS